MILIQRKRHGDGARWRTVLKVSPGQQAAVVAWIQTAMALDASVDWRATTADGAHVVTIEGAKFD